MEEQRDDIISIDFKAFFRILWDSKWLIIAVTSIFVLVGSWYSFTAREEFISEGKILPEVSGTKGGSLSGLASLVGVGGFDLNGSTDAIRPDLFPDIIKSTPFFLNLFKQKFITKNGDSVRFDNYYHLSIEENKEPNKNSLNVFKGNPVGVIVLNKLTEDRLLDLRDRINGSIDKKSGIINITVKMPDPVIAAQVAKYAMNYLTDYVSDYRTEKIKQEVDFLGGKVAAAKGEFYKDQARKANYADQFAAPTIRLQAADVQRERLESEYRMSSTVYNELLKKFEEAKIKLQQETPVFQVLEPPTVSATESEPKRTAIIMFALASSIILSLLVVLTIKKNYTKIFKLTKL